MLNLDMHIHTIMSGHAFCSLDEIVNSAIEKKIEAIAITDHGPNMIGSPHMNYFNMGERVKCTYADKLNVLFGCEANIVDEKGSIDITPDIASNLDVLLVGLHNLTDYKTNNKKENTRAIMLSLNKYNVNILAHPYREDFETDIEDLVYESLKTHTLLEINNSIFKNPSKNLKEQTRRMIKLLRKFGGKCIITSDAHLLPELGSDDNINRLKQEIELSDDILIKSWLEYREFFEENR